MKFENENGMIQHLYFTDVEAELSKIHPNYEKYKEDFEKSFEFINCGRPLYITLEVNDYCNMYCKMCWRNIAENPNGMHEDIDMNLLNKFIKQCAEMDMPSIFLGAISECLINPHIKEIIKMIKKDRTGIDDVLITNGYCLTEEICNLLIDCQWEKLFISLDAATPETYKRIRGRDLSVVENNIQQLLKIKEIRGSKLPFIRVSFVIMEENKNEIQMFIEKWKNKIDRIDFQTLQEPEDTLRIAKLPDTDKRCSDPFRKMQMDCHGNLFPCASLYKRYHRLGNIKDMTIQEAWNCDYIKKLREEMLTGTLNDVCKNCLEKAEHVHKINGFLSSDLK